MRTCDNSSEIKIYIGATGPLRKYCAAMAEAGNDCAFITLARNEGGRYIGQN
jgi:hypothetical protein